MNESLFLPSFLLLKLKEIVIDGFFFGGTEFLSLTYLQGALDNKLRVCVYAYETADRISCTVFAMFLIDSGHLIALARSI